MQLIENIRRTVSDFQKIITALTTALEANTSATSTLLETAQRVETAAESTAKSVAYLERADRHTRRSSGHEVPNV